MASLASCFDAKAIAKAFVAVYLPAVGRGAGRDVAVEPDGLCLGIDVEAVSLIPGEGAAYCEGTKFIVDAARSKPACVYDVASYSTRALQEGVLQNVDLAAEVLRAAAVDLHGASFQLHVASEAVIVIGSRQHTSTGLDKGAIGISSAQLAANSHIMPVGIDDGGFARDTGHIDIFGEGEVGICDQSTVMDADGAVSSQGRLCFDGQSAAGDSGNAAVGIGTGLGQQGYGARCRF